MIQNTTWNLNWVTKLQVNVINEEEGGCLIQFDWDDTDPELAEWTSWGEEIQKAFVTESLRSALDGFVDDGLTELVD
jgi:hypothetical protein